MLTTTKNMTRLRESGSTDAAMSMTTKARTQDGVPTIIHALQLCLNSQPHSEQTKLPSADFPIFRCPHSGQ
jgi:hypothetical protein